MTERNAKVLFYGGLLAIPTTIVWGIQWFFAPDSAGTILEPAKGVVLLLCAFWVVIDLMPDNIDLGRGKKDANKKKPKKKKGK